MSPFSRAERHVGRPERDEDATCPDRRVARIAADSWGVVSLDELRACGLSRDAIATRVLNGRLHRIHTTVYAVGHPGVPLLGRFLAAVKACGAGAVLSHASALVLWGILDWEERLIEVTVPGALRRHAGLRAHRSSRLAPEDVARRHGVAVTSPARTLLDVAARMDPAALRRAVRQAQALRLVSVSHLLEVIDRLGPCRGSARLASIVATGPAPTRSELEDRVLDLILAGGFAHPDVNVPLVLDGRRVIPDFRWPAQRLIVEADGAAWHDGKLAREDDVERQALLERAGERVLRVSWEQAVLRPGDTLARIAAAGAPPCS